MIDVNKLIGRRNGLVKEVIETYIDENEPKIYSFAAQRGFLDWERDKGYRSLAVGGGGGLTKEEALLRSCGEVVERYCSSFLRNEEFIRGSFNSLKNKYNLLNPQYLTIYSKKQYKQDNFVFREFTQDSHTEWVSAYSYKNKKNKYIPAFLVYLPYSDFEKGGKYYPSSSTGLSCAPSYEEAVLKGLLEIIERDAFSISWINQLFPPRIDINNIDEKYEELLRVFNFENINYNIFDITSDFGIPVIAALSFGNSSFGYVASLGLSCSTDYYRATKKALIENAQGRVSVAFQRKREPDKKYRDDFKDVVNFDDHSYIYSTDPTLKDKLSFLRGSNNEIKPNKLDKGKNLDEIIEIFLKKGFDVYAKDLTTPDIEDVGLKVVRVFVPGMVYLHGTHSNPFLGSGRMYKPSDIFKWCNIKTSREEDISSFPPHLLG